MYLARIIGVDKEDGVNTEVLILGIWQIETFLSTWILKLWSQGILPFSTFYYKISQYEINNDVIDHNWGNTEFSPFVSELEIGKKTISMI